MATLTNPRSADHLAAAAGEFEPQRQNNFSIEIALEGVDKDIIVMSLISSALPNESSDIVEMMFQNEKRKVAGQLTVEAIPMVLRDYVDQETRNVIMRWRKLVHDKKTGNIGRAADYKKDAFIILHGPDGADERICRLVGCWPQAVNGGTVDYNSSDPVEIEVTLEYDKPFWFDEDL